uniref:Uncharacterized protein L8382.07 n=1 Tax=Leishmania major TaxID=5664 RepID=Q9N870_LEIMA|nr:hypothetical protein L8382.07 [Leishmania major]
MSDAFDIDEDMKMRIRVLNEIMYEDELDDGQQDVHLARGDIIDGTSDSDRDDNGGGGQRRRERRRGGGGADVCAPGPPRAETWAAVEGPEAAAASAASSLQQRAPRDEYHDKRYHEKRSKDRLARTKQIQSARNERVPAYANKKKTSKAKAGGSKGSLQRAVKRGKFTADA